MPDTSIPFIFQHFPTFPAAIFDLSRGYLVKRGLFFFFNLIGCPSHSGSTPIETSKPKSGVEAMVFVAPLEFFKAIGLDLSPLVDFHLVATETTV